MKKSTEIAISIVGNCIFFIIGLLFIVFRDAAEAEYGKVLAVVAGSAFCFISGFALKGTVDNWLELRKVSIDDINSFWIRTFNNYYYAKIADTYIDIVHAVGNRAVFAAYVADNKTLDTYLRNADYKVRLGMLHTKFSTKDMLSYDITFNGIHPEVINVK